MSEMPSVSEVAREIEIAFDGDFESRMSGGGPVSREDMALDAAERVMQMLPGDRCPDCSQVVAALATARSLAIGETVTTVGELDALPPEAVIRVVAGNVAMKSTDRWAWVNRQGLYSASPLWLPARVLDLPEAGDPS